MRLSNIPFHLRFRLNLRRRQRYAARLYQQRPLEQAAPVDLPFAVASLSSQRDLPEQVESWRSLLRYMGTPTALHLVSDGSHSAADAAFVARLHPRARLIAYEDYIAPGLPQCVHDYARIHPFGKKLAIFLTFQQRTPVLYSDSDILYFPAAAKFPLRVETSSAPAHYLLDCAASHDVRLVQDPAEQQLPVNGGFVFFSRPVSFDAALERLAGLNGNPNFYSEQTLVHLAVRQAGGQPLPASEYVLQHDDQWRWRDYYAGPHIAIRHYISSIRHKMWQQIPV